MARREPVKVVVTDLDDAMLVCGTLNKMQGAAAVIDFDFDDDENRYYDGKRSEDTDPNAWAASQKSRLYVGRQVLLKVLDNQRGVLVYNGTITYALSALIHIERLEFAENIQRRSNVKVKVRFKAEVYPITVADLGFNEEITKHLDEKKAVLFRDISAGGCCFQCKTELAMDKLYQFEFSRMPQPFDLAFKILRCSVISPGREWAFGCQFQRMTPREEMILRQYVFKELASLKKKD
ncbi:MAG: PilZ domain-containing protein [Oscillospiraceae bacterium]